MRKVIAAQTKDYIAIDLGAVRCGIARASAAARLPEPLPVVPTPKLKDLLQEMVDDGQVEAVIIGLPRNLSGEDTAQTAWVREQAKKLTAPLSVPVYFQDEALTTAAAKERLVGEGDKIELDSEAAAIILQDFLDTKQEQRVRL